MMMPSRPRAQFIVIQSHFAFRPFKTVFNPMADACRMNHFSQRNVFFGIAQTKADFRISSLRLHHHEPPDLLRTASLIDHLDSDAGGPDDQRPLGSVPDADTLSFLPLSRYELNCA